MPETARTPTGTFGSAVAVYGTLFVFLVMVNADAIAAWCGGRQQVTQGSGYEDYGATNIPDIPAPREGQCTLRVKEWEKMMGRRWVPASQSRSRGKGSAQCTAKAPPLPPQGSIKMAVHHRMGGGGSPRIFSRRQGQHPRSTTLVVSCTLLL